MPDLQAVFSESVKLSDRITEFLKFSTFSKFSDLSGLDIDYTDPEHLFLRDELRIITGYLEYVKNYTFYLTRPIVEESRLRKGTSGKYRTEMGHFYDCRSIIEALVTDEYHEVPYWTRTIVEHDGEDYYLVGNKSISMEGLRVRVRA